MGPKTLKNGFSNPQNEGGSEVLADDFGPATRSSTDLPAPPPPLRANTPMSRPLKGLAICWYWKHVAMMDSHWTLMKVRQVCSTDGGSGGGSGAVTRDPPVRKPSASNRTRRRSRGPCLHSDGLGSV